jgi:hypothetical protein
MRNMHKVVNWVLFTATYRQKMKRLSAEKVTCEFCLHYSRLVKITQSSDYRIYLLIKGHMLCKRFKT